MRASATLSVCLAAISASCVGLLFLFGNSVRSEETKKANPRIKELQKQRIAVLEDVQDATTRLYQNARTSFEDVHAASMALMAARLDYADTREERIKACDEAIEQAQRWQELVKARVEAARDTQITVMKTQAYLLEAQIAREKAATDD